MFLLNRRAIQEKVIWLTELLRGVPSGVSFGGSSGGSSTNRLGGRSLYLAGGLWAVGAVSLVGFVVSAPPVNDLTVTFFETNRGDMIFVETPTGVRLLVDGGDDPDLAVQFPEHPS